MKERRSSELERVSEIFKIAYTKSVEEVSKISNRAMLVLFIAECAIILTYVIMGKINDWSDMLKYVNTFIVRTFIMIFIGWGFLVFIKFLLAKRGNLDSVKLDKLFSLSRLSIIACVMTYIHYSFPSVYATPIIVMFISVVFADARITKITAAFCILLTTAGTIINVLLKHNEMPYEWYIGFTMTLIFYLISLWIALKLINVEKSKESEQIDANAKLNEVIDKADMDGLTGVYNFNKIKKIFKDPKVVAPGLKIAMMDIDNFKHVNDTWGHDFGNVVLKRLGGLLKKIQNDNVFVARYGGEEFVVIANKQVSSSEFRRILSSLRIDFRNQEYRELGDNYITISLGYAEINENLPRLNKDKGFELLELADKALYVAKRTTKNRVVHYNKEDITMAIEGYKTYCDIRKDPVKFNNPQNQEFIGQYRYVEIAKMNDEAIAKNIETLDEIMTDFT